FRPGSDVAQRAQAFGDVANAVIMTVSRRIRAVQFVEQTLDERRVGPRRQAFQRIRKTCAAELGRWVMWAHNGLLMYRLVAAKPAVSYNAIGGRFGSNTFSASTRAPSVRANASAAARVARP